MLSFVTIWAPKTLMVPNVACARKVNFETRGGWIAPPKWS